MNQYGPEEIAVVPDDSAIVNAHVRGKPIVPPHALLPLLTSVAFGLFPAMELSRPDLASPLRTSGGRSWGPRLRVLVFVQMTLSLVLLEGAGLFLRTLQNARVVDVGFETEQMLQASFDLELAGYTDAGASISKIMWPAF